MTGYDNIWLTKMYILIFVKFPNLSFTFYQIWKEKRKHKISQCFIWKIKIWQYKRFSILGNIYRPERTNINKVICYALTNKTISQMKNQWKQTWTELLVLVKTSNNMRTNSLLTFSERSLNIKTKNRIS